MTLSLVRVQLKVFYLHSGPLDSFILKHMYEIFDIFKYDGC